MAKLSDPMLALVWRLYLARDHNGIHERDVNLATVGALIRRKLAEVSYEGSWPRPRYRITEMGEQLVGLGRGHGWS
jgi:hypothetical protein